jgi:hypothetical protein
MDRHKHYCCHCQEAFMVCRQEPDKCQISAWECPACISDHLDAYYNSIEPKQETTRAHQQRIPE